METSKYGKYIVTELKTPEFSPEAVAYYATYANRILWLDANVVEGAFQLNCSWYLAPATCFSDSHVHDVDEIIGFFGSNPENQHNLNAEIEFWLEDAKHIVTKSCLIFVPAGMRHNPLILKRVDKPIFHFSTVATGMYRRDKAPVR